MRAIKGNLIIRDDGSVEGGGATRAVFDRYIAIHPPANIAQTKAAADVVRAFLTLMDYIKDAPAPAPSVPANLSWTTAYDVDLRTLPAADFSGGDGTVTIDGRTWLWDNSANVTGAGLVHGSGLMLSQNGNSTDYLHGTRTTPILSIPISSLFPGYSVAGHVVRVMARVLIDGATANLDEILLGVEDGPSPTSQNFSVAKGYIDTGIGIQTRSTIAGYTRNTTLVFDNIADDVLALTFEAPSLYELWSAPFEKTDFPATLARLRFAEHQRTTLVTPEVGESQDAETLAYNATPLWSPRPHVFIALGTNNASVGFTATVTHLRLEFLRKFPNSSGTAGGAKIGDTSGGSTGDTGTAPVISVGPRGPAGNTGPAGAGYGGSSTSTNNIIASGTLGFTTQSGLAYVAGSRVRAASSASPTNYVEGFVTSYSGTLLVLAVDAHSGSGTFSAWLFSLSGERGTDGVNGTSGTGYGGTSTTSNTVAGSGTITWTTQSGLAYVVGSRVRVASSASPTNYVEGVVTSYSGTSLALAADNSGGSGTFTSWTLSVAGDKGATGATGPSGGGGGGGGTSWDNLYEVDFSSLTTATLSNGAATIDGKSWNVENAGNAASFGVVNGTGIRMVASTNSNDLFGSTRTAPLITVPLSTVIPTFSMVRLIRIMVQVSHNATSNFEAIFSGFEGVTSPATAGCYLYTGFSGALLNQIITNANSTGSNTPSSTAHTSDDVQIVIVNPALQTFEMRTGTYSSGWPTTTNFLGSGYIVNSTPQWTAGNKIALVLGAHTANSSAHLVATFKRLKVEMLDITD